MELLLFLSALLASLTGVISGERKAEPAQVQSSAAESAVMLVAEPLAGQAAAVGSAVIAGIAPLAVSAEALPVWHVRGTPAPLGRRVVSERRLE